jgi:DNA-binding MarR family transcriptional regulator
MDSIDSSDKPTMVDSHSLALIQATSQMADRVSRRICDDLAQDGFRDITPSQLQFLSKLDCGDNHASEIARILGVSRQRVAKSVAELVHLGYLRQSKGKGKQKLIQFTDRGQSLIASARTQLAAFDQSLLALLGKENMSDLFRSIEAVITVANDGDVNSR